MTQGKTSKAYPNYDAYIPYPNPRDTGKWIKAVQDMFYQIHKGNEKSSAFDNVTAGWNEMEKRDFSNWLKFYQENGHKKYAGLEPKTAQMSYWTDANKAGYFIPLKDNAPVRDLMEAAVSPEANPNVVEEERREKIEAQRAKIISRLNSLEKLITSPDGQMFVGQEFQNLINAIHTLKTKFHTLNKKSASTKLYEDMIVREANVLTKNGFSKAASVLHKFAQEAAPTAAPPAPPTQGGGQTGDIPNGGPASEPAPQPIPDMDGAEPISEGMSEFLKGLDTNNLTQEEGSDDAKSDDVLEVEDKDGVLVAEAQAAPPPPPPAKTEPEKKPEQDLEVVDNEAVTPPVRDFDAVLQGALNNISVSDIVSKLEDLAKIFKTREVPRQLAMVDMMLDHLGLASFFPSLAEATNKSLESNQYIATRVEDILSRLRGTMETKDLDLMNDQAPPQNPEAESIANRLQSDKAKDDARKAKKKQMEQEALDATPETSPEIEVTDDLEQPAEMKTEVPPAAPAAPPPAPAR